MTAMPHYKLTYFKVRGRAEGIRYILVQAGAPYEDERITLKQWAALKPTVPMGQIPILTIDNKHVLCQSRGIARMFAKDNGLAGATSYEQALADMYVEGIDDLYVPIRPTMTPVWAAWRKLDESQEVPEAQDVTGNADKEEWTKFKNDILNPFMDRYSGFLTSNTSGWLVGENVTWADLWLGAWMDRMVHCFDKGVMDQHPVLKAHWEKVHSLPKIKSYIASRPATHF